jgi:hypothetical protein
MKIKERVINILNAWAGNNRQSEIYPRLFNMFGKKRPLPKTISLRLRTLSRTVYARRAINAIKDPISQMQWDIRPKKGVKLTPAIQKQIDAATAVFEAPNTDDDFISFISQVLEDYLSVSAGTYEQRKSGDSKRPMNLYPTDGQSIQIIPAWEGEPNMPHYTQNITQGTEGGTTFNDEDLVYWRPNPTTDTPYGYGPLEVCARSISRQLGAGEFAGNLAANAAPANLIWLGPAGDTALDAFRRYWADEVEGQGLTPVLGGLVEPKAVRLHSANDEALYLKWQQFLIHEMATGFALSVLNFNPMMNAAGDIADISQRQDWQHAIRPTAKSLQSYLTRHTIHKGMGFTDIEFHFDGLDREDEKELAEIYKIYYQNNLTTPNDFRVNKLGIERSDNDWADKTYGDMQIAIGTARRGSDAGTGDLLDDPKAVKEKEAAPNRTYPSRA